MPQLDPSVFGSQLFWLVLCFGILFLLMAFVALPRIGRTLENRRKQMEADLAEAENLRARAEAALAAYDAALDEARAKALNVAQSMRAEVQAETDRQREKLDAELAAEAEAAETRLAAARQAALAGCREAACDIVADVLQAVGVEQPDKEAIRKAVEEADNGREENEL